MEPSTPRLSEYARKFVYPPHIEKTVWPRVEAKGLELGLGFDWWQSQLGTVCVGYGSDGKYVATVGGIGLSIPRQVGKTYFVLALLVILCILFPGLQVVWTAHHLRTSTKTFTSLRGICRRKKVAPHIKAMRAANGEQQVEFTNGSMIMFGARSMGFGRGFDEIDVEVFDEAQILDTKALEDMVAATNQSRHEHGALLFYMGAPPKPSDPSDAFTERRAEAWEGPVEDSIWLEIGADPKSDPNDRSQWPRMNPSYPTRTPLESMLRLRKNLKDDDSWNREGRGVWDGVADAGLAIDQAGWKATEDAKSEVEELAAFGVAVSIDRAFSAIGTAGLRGDELAHLELVHHGRGVGWVVDRCIQLDADNAGATFVIDGGGPAASLIEPLQNSGLTVVVLTLKDVAKACAWLVDGVTDRTLRHGPDPILAAAVGVTKWREVGDQRVFGRRVSSADITPIEAVTIAAHILPSVTALDDVTATLI